MTVRPSLNRLTVVLRFHAQHNANCVRRYVEGKRRGWLSALERVMRLYRTAWLWGVMRQEVRVPGPEEKTLAIAFPSLVRLIFITQIPPKMPPHVGPWCAGGWPFFRVRVMA